MWYIKKGYRYLLAGAGVVMVCAFPVWNWTVGAKRGKKIQGQLSAELGEIAVCREASVADRLMAFKSNLAVAGYVLKTPKGSVQVLDYYLGELSIRGWRPVKLGFKRNGEIDFENGEFVAKIWPEGDSTVVVEFAWNLR